VVGDKCGLSTLLEHAREIFETACQGGEDGEFTILIDGEGVVRMMPGTGWALDLLRLECGARAVYRVRRRGRQVSLEARSASERCLLETSSPAHGLRPVLSAGPRYIIAC